MAKFAVALTFQPMLNTKVQETVCEGEDLDDLTRSNEVEIRERVEE